MRRFGRGDAYYFGFSGDLNYNDSYGNGCAYGYSFGDGYSYGYDYSSGSGYGAGLYVFRKETYTKQLDEVWRKL